MPEDRRSAVKLAKRSFSMSLEGARNSWNCALSATVTSSAPLSLALAEHSVESLHALHGQRRPVMYWLLLAGVATGLASLPLVKVEVSVGAPGVIRPATERVELRVPYGGVVAEVFVRDNASVAAGQPLLRLATPDLDERGWRSEARQSEHRAAIAWLDKLSTVPAAGTVARTSQLALLQYSRASVE